MYESNPLALFETLNKTIKRYIPTTLPISRRFPELQSTFRHLINERELVKGPFVEALPDFKKGKQLRALLRKNGGFLNDGLSQLEDKILGRPLHHHQEIALLKSCRDNKSILVATGTGSGKTETFLYPLAHRLLEDPAPNSPGVRCLIIYPMNSLANDQLYYRIAPLFGVHLSAANITFGRFTSQIKANTDRKDEEIRLKNNDKLMRVLGNTSKIPSNWLLTREEMLRTPPKILITNYAMLEHLLLLPRNAPLFAQNTLQTIILDEIHTYTGAQATEVAFLIRKLKTRLKLDRQLQVFGTSASLPEGGEADQKICRFASDLFGEKIEDIVRGQRVPHQRLLEKRKDLFSIDYQSWASLGSALNQMVTEDSINKSGWRSALAESNLKDKIPALPQDTDFQAGLEAVFSANREIRSVSSILDKGGIEKFSDVAQQVFDQCPNIKNATDALSAVMHIGMLARSDSEGFPLLPGRYHLAISGIEGICIRPDSNNSEGWFKLKDLRQYTDDEGWIYYPLLVCRKCGQPFIEGFEHLGVLHNRQPIVDGGTITRKVFWLGSPPNNCTTDESDDDVEQDAIQQTTNKKDEQKFIFINPKTGEVTSKNEVTIKLYNVPTVEDKDDSTYYVRKCPACGGFSGSSDSEIITRMHPGNEALGSVVVQKLFEALPVTHNDHEPRPMGGRSLLSFSDNRQDAAFFAPYFERTSSDIALRTAIYQVLNKFDEPIDLATLGDQVFKYWQRNRDGEKREPIMLNRNGDILSTLSSMQDILYGKIAAEFFTPGGRRNSLEALGLVKVQYDPRKFKALINEVTGFIPERYKEQVIPLCRLLLENIRREKAIDDLYGLPMQDEFIWGKAYSSIRAFDLYKKDHVSHAWLTQEGTSRHNRRTWYLVKQLGWDENQSRKFLAEFWEALINLKFLGRLNPGYGLNGRLFLFENGKNTSLFVCKNCGLLQSDVVDNKCSAFHCEGDVIELTPTERAEMAIRNHYIYSYSDGNAMTARAREHTASLSTKLREEIESDFAEGKVNLLSCTTTMEMGVDLGELEAIVNLNIPPGIANYQQRTGRAGRRAQAAPFCVTVARNTQYDQVVFQNFHDYLGGRAPIPFLLLDNARLFRRHQNGIVLSGFLRHRITDLKKNAPSLCDLVGDTFGSDEHQSFMDDVDSWLESDLGQEYLSEAEKLADRLPSDLSKTLGFGPSELKKHFRDNMYRFSYDVLERWKLYTEKISQNHDKSSDSKSLKMQLHWTSMRERFMNQMLVEQISQRSLIPTYSFPVHTLTLEVVKENTSFNKFESEIALSRDAGTGISEYAPGAEVVANGRIWKSAGLAYYPKMFMPTEFYVACPACHHVDIGVERDDIPSECSNCGSTDQRKSIHAFLEPRGFVTSFDDRLGKDPGSNRHRQKRAEEARLITIPHASLFTDSDHYAVRTVLMKAQPAKGEQQSRLFIVNRGTYGFGYHICNSCNYAEPATNPKQMKKKHIDPLSGKTCRYDDFKICKDLAHLFETDVLILRFIQAIPSPPPEVLSPRQYTESFIRTLSEAIRFAASDILQIQPSELRATFLRKNQFADVVLYDASAGGAGYAVQLQQEVSLHKLLNKTIEKLSCPRQCSSACSICLCDYSNQFLWDQFDRHPVLSWLKEFVEDSTVDPNIIAGRIRWNKPSLNGLNERLKGISDIHLIGSTLDSIEGDDDKVRQWLIGLMNEGKNIFIHLTRPLNPPNNRMKSRQLQTFMHLYPFVNDERLNIGHVINFDENKISQMPRIFTDVSIGALSWCSGRPTPPLLEELLPEPVYFHHVDRNSLENLTELLKKTVYYPSDIMKEALPLQRWELPGGIIRNFKELFSVIEGMHVEKIIIKDPYCGVGKKQRERLIDLLNIVTKLAGKVTSAIIHCREQNYNDQRYMPPYKIKESLSNDLAKSFPIIKSEIHVHDSKTNRVFHDRTLEFQLVDSEGCTLIHRFDLSGGIDFLMDNTTPTKIYRYQVQP